MALHILLVDDNRDLSEMVCQMLEWQGHTVTYLDNGQAGLDWVNVRETPPDVILCDLLMPHVNGHTILRTVRNERRWLHVPFVMLSANVLEADQQAAFMAGADDYITKPFSMRRLTDVLSRWDSV